MFKSFNDYYPLKPSSMQTAIALFAGKWSIEQNKKGAVFQIGAGKGKSRVIACLALFFMYYKR